MLAPARPSVTAPEEAGASIAWPRSRATGFLKVAAVGGRARVRVAADRRAGTFGKACRPHHGRLAEPRRRHRSTTNQSTLPLLQ